MSVQDMSKYINKLIIRTAPTIDGDRSYMTEPICIAAVAEKHCIARWSFGVTIITSDMCDGKWEELHPSCEKWDGLLRRHAVRETRLEDVNVTLRREADRDVVIIHCRPDPDLSSIRGNFESVYLTFRECAAARIDSKSEQGQGIEGDKV